MSLRVTLYDRLKAAGFLFKLPDKTTESQPLTGARTASYTQVLFEVAWREHPRTIDAETSFRNNGRKALVN